MQDTLEEFVRALRAVDVRVSPAEAIDAARAVRQVGYADRELFKDALCVSLAKSAEEVVKFDQTFETFFTREAFTLPPEDAGAPDQEPETGEASGAADSELAQMLLRGDAAGMAQAMEEAAQRAGVAEIRLSTQRSRLTRRLLDEMGLAEIERNIAKARRLPEGEGFADRLDRGRRALVAEAQA